MRLKNTVGWFDERSEFDQVWAHVDQSKEVVNFGTRLVDFDTPQHIRDAAKKAIDEGITRYPPSPGIPELREALAEKLQKENGIEVDPLTEVIITNGGNEAMFDTIHTIVEPGDEVIVSDPGYSMYPMIIDLAGGTPIYVATHEDRNFRLDPSDIKDSVTPKTKLIVLVTPDNPTGSVLTENDVKAIAEIAKDNDLYVFSDQMYEKIIYDDHKHYSIASIPGMKERTITIGGFSKAYAMTGWRVGYAVTHKELATPIIDLHCMNVTQGCIISQKGAVAALKGPEPRYIWDEFEKRRNTLADGLNDIPGITCQKNWGGICLMANISSFGMSSLEFAKYIAKETNVIASPGTAFGHGTVGGTGGKGYISFGYAATKNETIKMAVDKMSEAVKKLAKR